MLEDRLLELSQLVAWIEPKLLGEQSPATLIDVESVGLPPGAVEGASVALAASRVTAPHARVPRAPGSTRRPCRARGRRRFGARSQPRAGLELRPLVPRDRVVEIRERGAAPQRERLSQQFRRGRRALPARFFDQPLEPLDVDRARLDDDQVAGSSRDDGVATERFSELRDVDLQRSRGRVGRRAVPELVDQLSRETTRFACRRRSASSARCFDPPRASRPSLSPTSSGPRIR